MKAIRLLEFGGPLVFDDVPAPAIARDEVLVKIKSTAVNHIDLVKASGTLRQILPIDLPWIPGHEFSGIVEQIGTDVVAYAPGDAVFGTRELGAYAEFLAVKPATIVKKPSNLSFEEAASVPVASETAWEGIFTHGHLEKGQTILIHGGAGAVGAYAVQLASHSGATVIATASGDDEAYVKSIGDGGPKDSARRLKERKMKTSITTHDGRVALVTGASQGIGQAMALALAERGARVIATDLEPPHETVREIGPGAYAIQLDVTQEEHWRSVAGKAQDLGDVDIVVNNAGYFPNRTIDDLDLPTWRKTMATNLDSHFLSVKYFLPAMRKKKWGRFVGISSNMIGLAIPGMSHYITTKMGIIGFMRGLANDVASDGITANSVLPGLTNTLAISAQSDEQKRDTWSQQAIKRLGEPGDVTGAVLFLTSDDATFITGQAIVVDGGQYRIG